MAGADCGASPAAGGEPGGDRIGVRLVRYTEADLPLTVELERDSAVKSQLGGPITGAEAERIHRRRLELMRRGDRFFGVLPDGSDRPVGIAALFRTEWDGGVIHEAGVMLLPSAQRGGVGSAALRMLVEHARFDETITEVHGFTAVANRGGNEICRRLGFTLVGECDVDYEGRPVRCRHWVFELTG